MSRWLSREDVQRITKRKKFAAQRRRLDELGIRFRQAADGEPLVPEDAVDGAQPKARNTARWHLINA